MLGILAAVGTVMFYLTKAVGIDRSDEVIAAQKASILWGWDANFSAV